MAAESTLTIDAIPGSAPGTMILRLAGPMTLANLPPLRAHLRSGEPPRLTILDMTGVSFMDSSGINEIISHEVYCRDHHVRLALAGVTPRVLGVLQITRLDKVLTIAATVEAAEAMA
ncbi:MAG: STAS domain-containing protein [Terracidiphilus sp.]|jgi:anti-sigma B factor antagonist